MFRRVLVASVVLLALLAATSRASSTSLSPCRHVSQPVWSPDGTKVAYYGMRWPPPTHPQPTDILQALCTANADGSNVRPLRYTVCSERCPGFDQIAWVPSDQLLYLRGGDIFRIVPGSKAQRVAQVNAVSFVTNPAGMRIATNLFYPGCLSCAGPVTILDAQSGAVVGTVGGNRLENMNPSLSPDGSQVVFERNASNNSGKTFGIWTANVDGSHLRQLAKVGQQPLWSPAGGKVAYVAPAGKSVVPVALRLISAGGGKSRALVPKVSTVFGWSPDGTFIAFEAGSDRLSVVDVATGKVRTLIKLRYEPSVIWSPDSSELLAATTPAVRACPSLYRVPVDGSKPTLISRCS